MAADAIDATAPAAGGAPEAAPAAPAAPAPAAPAVEAPADPWAEVLGQIPADLHETVRPHFDGFSSKLTEATEALDAWKPYEELGLREASPESLKGWFEWMAQLDSPETAGQAILALAESCEIDLAQLTGGQPAVPAAGGDDPVQQAIAPLLQQIEQLEQRLNGQDEAQLAARTEAEVREQLQADWAEVVKQHGKPLTEAESEQLKKAARAFVATSDTPISDAYAFITELKNGAQNELVEGAPTQPSTATDPAPASTTARPPDTFEEAERQLRQRRAQAAAL